MYAGNLSRPLLGGMDETAEYLSFAHLLYKVAEKRV
jgi:hypothetical protein